MGAENVLTSYKYSSIRGVDTALCGKIIGDEKKAEKGP